MRRIFVQILLSLFIAGCGGDGGGSDSQPVQTGNTISVLGVDGEMAGADIAVYHLQDYLKNPSSAENLLAASPTPTTHPETALADNLELVLDAGLGPFMVVITANPNTKDLTTGEEPVISEVKTIVTDLSSKRVYATPLTTAAVALASEGETVDQNVLLKLRDAKAKTHAFFGFGMGSDIDIFTVPPILDEETLLKTDQEKVAEYRAAIEALAAIIEKGNFDFDLLIDDLKDGVLDNSDFSNAAQAMKLEDITSRFADQNINSIAGLLNKNITSLAEYTIDPVDIDKSPMAVIDSDGDGFHDGIDDLKFDPTENKDTDGDLVGDNADAFDDDPTETKDTDGDLVGDNKDNDDDGDGYEDVSDAFPLDKNEHLDTDGDLVGNNEDEDDDGDGFNDLVDVFPLNKDEHKDTDEDGIGDNSDPLPETPNATFDVSEFDESKALFTPENNSGTFGETTWN